ncbi:MAG: winged helix-turn-helix transcriptional regulator [Candidatus Rokubacteria bacterium]|nr:winged helix-turn-helix transcriptional regulator [Candidatus Rokubacteria bacterium]
MDQTSQRELRILSEIAERPDVTQRSMSRDLGIALGLMNLYVKRLIVKGYVKATSVHPNRVRYLLTPHGIGEKSRLTYEFMSFSLFLYAETRKKLRAELEPLVAGEHRAFAIYGTGEAAELAYLTLKELSLEPVAVYAETGPATFLGMPVRPTAELADARVDRVIVAAFDMAAEREAKRLRGIIPDEKIIVLGPIQK